MKNPHATRWMLVVYALTLAAGASYAAAQGKAGTSPKPAQQCAGCAGPAQAPMQCPMEEVGPIADVQVENTTEGAVIRLKAKSASDVQRIQRMAAMIAEHMSAGMKGVHGGMQHGGMQHGGMHGARRSAAPSPPTPNTPRAR